MGADIELSWAQISLNYQIVFCRWPAEEQEVDHSMNKLVFFTSSLSKLSDYFMKNLSALLGKTYLNAMSSARREYLLRGIRTRILLKSIFYSFSSLDFFKNIWKCLLKIPKYKDVFSKFTRYPLNENCSIHPATKLQSNSDLISW